MCAPLGPVIMILRLRCLVTMVQRKRLWFVVFSAVAIAAIVVLAGSLSTLDLSEPGVPLPRSQQLEERESPPPRIRVVSISRHLFLIIGAVLLVSGVILYLVSPEARKALQDLMIVICLLLPFLLLSRLLSGGASGAVEELEEIRPAPGASGTVGPAPDVPVAPEPQQWWILAVTVGTALVLAGVLVGVGWAVWRRTRRSASSLDKLAEQAQYAIDAIEAGADLRDTVMRCYFEMMQVLREERGIQRQQAMTPREFEVRLEQLGVPTTQVRRLTRLFEDVRYGNKRPDQQDERQALVSLSSIVRFCRSAS